MPAYLLKRIRQVILDFLLKGPLRKMNFEETTFDRNEAGSDLPSSLNHLAKKTSYCPAPSFWSSGLYLLLGPKRDGDW